ncbi:L,D-transpeptidase family protein [Schaalia sp. lx-260]|uniref:L,D-transpeptidase family protein n=1 Tax=Schaalia sp. lx-260 TaxID=2899082 RepID=UPI001E5A2D7C|nr:L,D-transpeptidase [Schaalia sp. lx-260]MCD4548910.1 L,D-transpeptidase [Schaalia sp. lx-260]
MKTLLVMAGRYYGVMARESVKKVVIITSAVIGGLLVLGAAGGTAYALHYSERALPRTTIAGHSISGLDRAAVEGMVKQLADDTVLTIDVAGKTQTASLADMGFSIDVPATVDGIFAPNASVMQRFTALTRAKNIEPVVVRDNKNRDSFIEKIRDLAGESVVQSQVVSNDQGVFTVSPGKAGKDIDRSALEVAMDEAANMLAAHAVTVNVKEVEPTITTDKAQAVADEANAMASVDLTITDGVDNYQPNLVQKASWITVKEENGNLENPIVDHDKVREWVDKAADLAKLDPQPGIDNVDANGTVLAHAKKARDGLTVNNAEAMTDALSQAMTNKTSYSGKFEFDRHTPENLTRPVLAGYQNYVYPASEGEKWVDVNLTTNTATAYEGYNVVHGPVLINHGAVGKETVEGTYQIYLKYEKQTMGCVPGYDYCVKDVPWVMYFVGSYALHGTPWREVFGTGQSEGSSGCVNLPVPEAKWFHGWTEIGTTVVTHH